MRGSIYSSEQPREAGMMVTLFQMRKLGPREAQEPARSHSELLPKWDLQPFVVKKKHGALAPCGSSKCRTSLALAGDGAMDV